MDEFIEQVRQLDLKINLIAKATTWFDFHQIEFDNQGNPTMNPPKNWISNFNEKHSL